MERLRQTVGTRPESILGATEGELIHAAGFGILRRTSAVKLRRAAGIAVNEFDGDLAMILELPVDRAKRALRRFPGIGEPGAEKILLVIRCHPFLAPDSNALRVMVRLGFCSSCMSYAKTYAAAREVAERELGGDFDVLIGARRVLRHHGQVTCRRNTPECESCVLRDDCPWVS
jgi:endonuclease-3